MKTVYIVDDEANIRDLIKKYLVKEGFRAEAFSCAEDVLNATRRDQPGLFVLDITTLLNLLQVTPARNTV